MNLCDKKTQKEEKEKKTINDGADQNRSNCEILHHGSSSNSKWQLMLLYIYHVSMSHLDTWISSLMCTLQLLIWTVIYFNKTAGISCGWADSVCREAPAAAQIRAIDLALSSTGQSGSQRRQHKGNRRTQLASWPPALIIIPIRKKMSRCSSGYIMVLPSRLCPQV